MFVERTSCRLRRQERGLYLKFEASSDELQANRGKLAVGLRERKTKESQGTLNGLGSTVIKYFPINAYWFACQLSRLNK